LQLRPIAEGDLEFARLLRNANREFFFYDAEISAEQQLDWFRTLGSKSIDFFVIEDDGVLVGTISAKRSPGWVEIGNLLLTPAARGKGLMRQAVSQLTTAPGRYFAEVKSHNERSLVVFRAMGFTVASIGPCVRLEKTT
jgi:RimJ/RimL family protein N-acetyltransferase